MFEIAVSCVRLHPWGRAGADLLHLRLGFPAFCPVPLHPRRHRFAGRCRHRARPSRRCFDRLASHSSTLWQPRLRKGSLDGDDLGTEVLERHFGAGAREWRSRSAVSRGFGVFGICAPFVKEGEGAVVGQRRSQPANNYAMSHARIQSNHGLCRGCARHESSIC
jgi:hypothetical protein